MAERIRSLESETMAQRKDAQEYREKLRVLLNIQESPLSHEIIPQHIEDLLEKVKG